MEGENYVFIIFFLSLLSQSLLVFFLYVSQAQIMYLEHKLLKSIILFMHWGTFLRIRADPSTQIFWISVIVALSDTFLIIIIIIMVWSSPVLFLGILSHI